MNRGFELILNGRKKENLKTFNIQFPGGKKMTIDTNVIVSLVLPVSLLFFFTGILTGWVARDYLMNYRELPHPHPEMFDGNGNLFAVGESNNTSWIAKYNSSGGLQWTSTSNRGSADYKGVASDGNCCYVTGEFSRVSFSEAESVVEKYVYLNAEINIFGSGAV